MPVDMLENGVDGVVSVLAVTPDGQTGAEIRFPCGTDAIRPIAWPHISE
jgi:hypothetical protein